MLAPRNTKNIDPTTTAAYFPMKCTLEETYETICSSHDGPGSCRDGGIGPVGDHIELAAGVSLQLRNASLGFESTNGESVVVTQDLGIVPILKLRGEYVFVDAAVPGAFVGLEADGFYASSAFFNGAEYEFEGSVFDVSLRAGFEPMPGVEIFFNIRGFGGGSSGTRGDAREFATQSRDGFTETYLTAMSVTLGARLN
jgi:hypothetical protein